MSDALRMPRIALGVLTLSAGVPFAAMQWAELSAERDALDAEVQRLEAELARRGTHAEPDHGTSSAVEPASWGGRVLAGSDRDSDPALHSRLAAAEERQVELTTEAAALRRQLAHTRAELADWERTEGALDMALVDQRGSSAESDGTPSPELLDLMAQEERTRRRLAAVEQEHVSVQAEREEALAQLRREMFSNLQYSAIIGECGHRTGRRSFEDCSDKVRNALRPYWDRFEACVEEFNAIPAYTDSASAQDVAYSVQLDRGAVLMCDPALPETGR